MSDTPEVKKDPKYKYSPCCNVLGVKIPIQLHKSDGNVEIGHVGLCGNCYRYYREPHLHKSAPPGYMFIWNTVIKNRDLRARWAADVEIKDGKLVAFDDSQRLAPIVARMVKTADWLPKEPTHPEPKKVKPVKMPDYNPDEWIESEEVPF